MKQRRAVALVYVLLVSVILLVFLTALFYRVRQSLQVVTSDLHQIQARNLAQLGLHYGLVRMRDNVNFASAVQSTALGPGYTAEELGGTFDLQILSRSDLGGSAPFPATGTYKTMICQARVGRRTARSAATVKIASPLLDYLFLAKGKSALGFSYDADTSVRGPIFVNEDPLSPGSGDLWLPHDGQLYIPQSGRWSHISADLDLSGIFQAYGSVYLKGANEDPRWAVENPSAPRYTKDERQLRGDIPAGTRYQQVDFLPKAGSISGSVTFRHDSRVEPEARLNVKIASTNEIFRKLRSQAGDSNVVQLDVSALSDGVLVEFVDGKVHFSQVARRTVGRVYDRALFTDPLAMNVIALSDIDRAGLLRECVWNDPDFPDQPVSSLPAALRTGELNVGLGGTADYFEVKRIVRGPQIRPPLDLDRNSWTVLYLTTNDASRVSADGVASGPPVFLRGVVRGKVAVYYDDLTHDNIADAGNERIGIFPLCQHEDADDLAAADRPLESSPGPGVPGGLRYANTAAKEEPDSAGSFSPDHLVVVSRGLLNGVGDSGQFRGVVYTYPGGVRLNYRDTLEALDHQVSSKYAGRPNDPNYRVNRLPTVSLTNDVMCPIQGQFIGNTLLPERGRLTADGRILYDVVHRRFYRIPWLPFNWSAFGSRALAGTAPGSRAFFPLNMRYAESTVTTTRLRGGMHSTAGHLKFFGHAQYDYKFRDIDEETLDRELKLPLTIEIASWQNL